MAFMQPEVYYGTFFRVETTQGSEIVPCDVVGRTMAVHVDYLLDYLEGSPLDGEECVPVYEGWLARMSAPGYTDCTAWGAYPFESVARGALAEMYGDDDAEGLTND